MNRRQGMSVVNAFDAFIPVESRVDDFRRDSGSDKVSDLTYPPGFFALIDCVPVLACMVRKITTAVTTTKTKARIKHEMRRGEHIEGEQFC